MNNCCCELQNIAWLYMSKWWFDNRVPCSELGKWLYSNMSVGLVNPVRFPFQIRRRNTNFWLVKGGEKKVGWREIERLCKKVRESLSFIRLKGTLFSLWDNACNLSIAIYINPVSLIAGNLGEYMYQEWNCSSPRCGLSDSEEDARTLRESVCESCVLAKLLRCMFNEQQGNEWGTPIFSWRRAKTPTLYICVGPGLDSKSNKYFLCFE